MSLNMSGVEEFKPVIHPEAGVVPEFEGEGNFNFGTTIARKVVKVSLNR